MDAQSGVGIVSTAISLPERRVPNAEIAEVLQLEAQWISRRTGIHERRFAGDDERNVDFACAAAASAVDR